MINGEVDMFNTQPLVFNSVNAVLWHHCSKILSGTPIVQVLVAIIVQALGGYNFDLIVN